MLNFWGHFVNFFVCYKFCEFFWLAVIFCEFLQKCVGLVSMVWRQAEMCFVKSVNFFKKKIAKKIHGIFMDCHDLLSQISQWRHGVNFGFKFSILYIFLWIFAIFSQKKFTKIRHYKPFKSLKQSKNSRPFLSPQINLQATN